MLQSYEVRNKITRLLLSTIGREHDEENQAMRAGAVAPLVIGAVLHDEIAVLEVDFFQAAVFDRWMSGYSIVEERASCKMNFSL